MLKKILLSLSALLLIGGIVFAIWYLNEAGKIRSGCKDSFIPNNSAFIININSKPEWSEGVEELFCRYMPVFHSSLTATVVDSLRSSGRVPAYPYVLAGRVEGKNDVVLLYVMDCREVLARNEITDYLRRSFSKGKERIKKYDHHKIYVLGDENENCYFSICGGIILVSDSELYVEDGLKQFDSQAKEGSGVDDFENVSKYFSASAGVNILVKKEMFSELLPLFVNMDGLFPSADFSGFFEKGVFDGEFIESGVCLNGLMFYGSPEKSYIRTLAGQQPRESSIEKIVPASLVSLELMSLSQPADYFSSLENYRYSIGKKEEIYNRKQQFRRMFGKNCEEDLQELLQGEFAVVDFMYQTLNQERDGLVMVALKSGSLGRDLIEKMLDTYARFDGGDNLNSYRKEYGIDEEKLYTYYRFPVEDLPCVYWGYLFEGLKSRYVLVEDNCLIFASSEQAVERFFKDYVHGSFIGESEWYQALKNKLARKYNLACFVRTGDRLPFYRTLAKGKTVDLLSDKAGIERFFPSFAMQWSNEGDMLYHTLFLNTLPFRDDVRPHVLWQTRLDAKLVMKPVSVENHVTGEKELFVQDVNNCIYLINDAGRILWKLPLEEKINSEVYQVDLYKNGKLQYLFSTPSKIYLIDRNGNTAGNFPLILKNQTERGITLCDYDGNKDYRIFVPCIDRNIYLYDMNGRIVKGWNPEKADKPIVSKVQHFRVDGKDYIVFADRYRLYILDRRGRERVKVKTVFDLPENVDIYLVQRGNKPYLLFAGVGGEVNLVGFDGTTQKFTTEITGKDFCMNVADVDRDGMAECVFVEKNCILIYDLKGELQFKKQLDAFDLDYPYVYRFSANDVRIGVTDMKKGKMLLLDAGGSLSKGFPIDGDSPFSIVFAGSDGFFLFAGAENGSVIKYRVQR